MYISTHRNTNFSKRSVRFILIVLLPLLLPSCLNTASDKGDAWVFYYFEGYAGEKAGLFSAYSYDLRSWHPLKDSLLDSGIGEFKVFRDPSVCRTPDGIFHAIWTTGKTGFGYARSENGIGWSDKRFITVADPARGFDFANVWAPEFYIEGDSIHIIWSSTLMADYVPPADPEKWWTSTWNHRFYIASTSDFETFTPTKPFWDAGFNAIDAVVYKTDSLYYLFFKDERRPPKQIMMAECENLRGPYQNIQPLAYTLTEGAIAMPTDTAFVLYYDYYHEYNGYRYITTSDMKNWSEEIMPEKVGFEDVIRHGSIVRVTEGELNKMKELVGIED